MQNLEINIVFLPPHTMKYLDHGPMDQTVIATVKKYMTLMNQAIF